MYVYIYIYLDDSIGQPILLLQLDPSFFRNISLVTTEITEKPHMFED